jgi:hypothetical protein
LTQRSDCVSRGAALPSPSKLQLHITARGSSSNHLKHQTCSSKCCCSSCSALRLNCPQDLLTYKDILCTAPITIGPQADTHTGALCCESTRQLLQCMQPKTTLWST